MSYCKHSLPYASLQLLKIVVSDLVDEGFHISPQEKIQCDKSGDLGGQTIAVPPLIHPPGVVWYVNSYLVYQAKNLSSVVESPDKGQCDSGKKKRGGVCIKIKKQQRFSRFCKRAENDRSESSRWIPSELTESSGVGKRHLGHSTSKLVLLVTITHVSEKETTRDGSTPDVWATMLHSAKCGDNVVLVASSLCTLFRDGRESDVLDRIRFPLRLPHCYSQWSLFEPR